MDADDALNVDGTYAALAGLGQQADDGSEEGDRSDGTSQTVIDSLVDYIDTGVDEQLDEVFRRFPVGDLSYSGLALVANQQISTGAKSWSNV
jgi:hypothetical protein